MRSTLVLLTAAMGTSTIGCVPELPGYANVPTLDQQTNYFKSGIVKSQVEACAATLDTERFHAKTQRDIAAVVSFLGGATGIASGTISGTMDKDKESTKNTLAFIAAGGAAVALAAPLVGNPSDTLKEHAKRWKHWERAKDAMYNLNWHVLHEPTKAPDEPPQVGPEPPATTPEAHVTWAQQKAAHDAWEKVRTAHEAWESKGKELTDIIWKEANACSGDPDQPASVVPPPAGAPP